jgi:hypothetical protein
MAADASRHLLFGLLGLQVGLIDPGQHVVAFQAWTRDKPRSLADHFVALGHLGAAQRSVVEALVSLHVQAHGDDVQAKGDRDGAIAEIREAIRLDPEEPAYRTQLSALLKSQRDSTMPSP